MDIRKRVKNRFSGGPRAVLAKNMHAIMLLAIFAFGFWIRQLPADGMQYLQALDPYMIARMSEAIVTEGGMPAYDVWRYFPYLTPTFGITFGNIAIPAYLYLVVAPFGVGFLTYAQLVPAFFGALMIVAMYFIGTEAFNRDVGLGAAFFLAASAAVLHRSSAGWYEKEPLGGFFILSTLYFFLRAWRRKSWVSGGLAGISLALAQLSWGGTQYLHLLLPFVVFVALLLNVDVERLVVAYTPTVLFGHFFASVFNPARWTPLHTLAVGALGMLLLLWVRYLIEAFELVPEDYLGYVTPGLTVAGFIAGVLSPLYSQWVAGKFFSLLETVASGGGTGVIGGTVAENAPAGVNQIISQLGAAGAAGFLPRSARMLVRLVGPWNFALIGLTGLTLVVFLMMGRKYLGWTSVGARKLYFAVPGLLLTGALVMFMSAPQLGISILITGGIALLGAIVLAVYPRDEITIPARWDLLLIFLWAITAIWGVTERSRLMFLTAQPVALLAGYAVVTWLHEFRGSGIWEKVTEQAAELQPRRVFTVVLVLILVPVVAINAASAYAMAQNVGGSPNSRWMENLDYMRTETPVDSVILSWWDYGYWFESIGGRAAIADGGNLNHYSNGNGGEKINFPLADFLTAKNTSKHYDWLDGLSVDYVVLDATMIGKYSAVSQIHNRDNSQFTAMQSFSCLTRQREFRGRQVQVCARQQARNNQTYISYQARGARFHVPVDPRSPNPAGSPPTSAPLFQGQQGTAAVANFCSTEGIIEYEVPDDQRALPGCLAWHPLYQHRRIVYVPQQAMGSTLVDLYLMDGADQPAFEKVPAASNGYVKMWRYDRPEN